jgi:Protein of unknown function (DUF1765)
MLPVDAEVKVVPAVPVHSLKPVHSTPSPPHESLHSQDKPSSLSRSASYTNVPGVQEPQPTEGIKRTFSDEALAFSPERLPQNGQSPYLPSKELLRSASRSGKGKVAVTKFTVSAEDVGSATGRDTKKPAAVGVTEKPKPSTVRSVSGTFRNLAKRPWKTSSSRSPSPSPKEAEKRVKPQSISPDKRQSISNVSEPVPAHSLLASRPPSRSSDVEDPELETSHVVSPAPRRRPSLHRLASRRPLSAIVKSNTSETELRLSKKPSLQLLHSRSSSDKLPKLPLMKVPPIPSSLSSDRLSSASFDANKKKDPLWSVFRALEGDFQKSVSPDRSTKFGVLMLPRFQSKSSALKANVIRTCLLPFLAKYADHISNRTLRSEDLDRRAMILNKWWTGLLEMLHGRNNQSISGTDRPTYLEGVVGVMVRPEWRIPPYPISLQVDTPPDQRLGMTTSTSTTSLESGGSDFLTESVHHNVRNIFVQNLLSQMAFVVDKMSLRSAPASLVAFCGQACAYAFFFCPGVADILVRLWHLSTDSIRRILTELGFPRGSKLDAASTEVASHFPPALRSLAITSQSALVKYLHHKMPLPLGAAYIRWYGPWMSRWSGRDSDLFFVFTKHFHLLVAEILPGSVEKMTRACVPGLVPVHAQILTVFETTLYRQTGQQQGDMFASSALDELDSPDAAAAMPLSMANAARSMAENRLIMLLRDLLAEPGPGHQELRNLYAESFRDIIKCATRKISLYNHDACFVLCDFMEEVLTIMSRYHQTHGETNVLDWAFWLQVCQQMMGSQNTLTEIRLLAFLYSTWNILISDENRRKELCLDWLLLPSFFERHFNHWCPMVRAYYLRLLCWRVARYDGDATDLDIAIYEALADRLRSSWASYLYQRNQAEALDYTLPSSAPCSPAPGRRLIIIRNDCHSLPVSMFTSFDKVISQMSSTPSTTSSASIATGSNTSDSTRNSAKKRWNFMKNIMPFSTPGNMRPGEVTPPGTADDSSAVAGSEAASMSDTISMRSSATTTDLRRTRPSTPPYRPFSFKFSLEWLDRPNWPSKNRRLSSPKLPLPAQILIQLRQEAKGDEVKEVEPRKPSLESTGNARYAGRALAEWAQIVGECEGFFERRKDEGVPSNRLVETPVLGVESFRMYG